MLLAVSLQGILSNLRQTWKPTDDTYYLISSTFAYIHVSGCYQAATGWAGFDGGDLRVHRRGLLGVRHFLNFVCKTKPVHDVEVNMETQEGCKASARTQRAKHKLIIHGFDEMRPALEAVQAFI